jgi:NAD(P)-dependent dehydrogenase (short-subunit alcohol dehydrogenase family)
MKLEPGQVAVVTGGASGIGFALCAQFAQAGLHVVMSDIDDAALAAAAGQLAAGQLADRRLADGRPPDGAETPGPVLTVRTDVTSADEVSQLAQRTLSEFGQVDVVCNNAGTVGKNLPLWEFERVEWEWIMAVDFWGVIHGISAFVPLLVAQGSGHVVNTASMASLSTVPLNGPYNAAKHAVLSVSETLAADLRTQGVSGVGVTVVCPGPTRTRLMTEGPRERPERYRPKVDRGVTPQRNPNTFAGSTDHLLEPDGLAVQVLGAIESGQFLLAPHPGSLPRVEARYRPLLDDLIASGGS